MMTPFTRLTAVAAPLLRDNIDTDAIIPSREMTAVTKTGLAAGLFAGWRYVGGTGRAPDPGFVLNDPAYAGAQVLLAGANFGCGSSREHAAWALAEFGFRVVVASSFNPIFAGNAVRNGIVPVVLPAPAITDLGVAVTADPATRCVTVDLAAQEVVAPNGTVHRFAIAAEAKDMLRHGLDAIDLTLRHDTAIAAFVAADRVARGWAYRPVTR